MSETGTESPKQQHACPAWITPELIRRTLTVWQPRSAAVLTDADAVEILTTVGRLGDVLHRKSPRSPARSVALQTPELG
ncbi:MAG: hypothetical protein KatS3mg082_3172 [Nitrospiraceae bacterium]|nr:MAG: hypothetical protein KatS3mg082_3172 [Nitrospiraceae bacterium]